MKLSGWVFALLFCSMPLAQAQTCNFDGSVDNILRVLTNNVSLVCLKKKAVSVKNQWTTTYSYPPVCILNKNRGKSQWLDKGFALW